MDSGISVWVPVISVLAGSVLTGTIQYFMNRQNHFFALKREEKATADRLNNEKQIEENKQERERIFIAAELIFMLEQYAEGCARVAADHGNDNPDREPEPTVNYPLLNLTDVSGDWRVLSRLVMYRIRELPVLQNEAQRTIDGVGRYDHSPYYSDYFRERQYQFARLGMKAVILAIRLRKTVGLPESRLRDTEWSAYNVLWKVWRRERKIRAVESIINRPWHEPVQLNNENE